VTQLRRPLLALVALFTAAITIDRFGVGHGTGAISSATYALAGLAVAAPLTIGWLRRGHHWAASTVACSAYATLLLTTGTTGRSVYVIATEVVFLVLAVRLGHHLARTVARFDETLGVIVFGDSRARDIESPESAETIHDEIARSRRHGRPLSLTVLSPATTALETAVDNAALEVDRAVRRRFVYGKLARTVAGQLRRSDLLFEHRASGRLFVISPETDPDGTALLVKRVVEATVGAGIPASAGSASFPNDAIAFESLVAAAEADLAHNLEAEPHLRSVANGTAR
jgi:hypothetical protein